MRKIGTRAFRLLSGVILSVPLATMAQETPFDPDNYRYADEPATSHTCFLRQMVDDEYGTVETPCEFLERLMAEGQTCTLWTRQDAGIVTREVPCN